MPGGGGTPPRENKERFSKEFDIYFDDEIVDSCKGEKEKDGCSVIIDNND